MSSQEIPVVLTLYVSSMMRDKDVDLATPANTQVLLKDLFKTLFNSRAAVATEQHSTRLRPLPRSGSVHLDYSWCLRGVVGR